MAAGPPKAIEHLSLFGTVLPLTRGPTDAGGRPVTAVPVIDLGATTLQDNHGIPGGGPGPAAPARLVMVPEDPPGLPIVVSARSGPDGTRRAVVELGAERIVDDAEHGDTDEYDGSNSALSINTNTVKNGSNAIEISHGGTATFVRSTAGLPNYPTPGDTFTGFVFLWDGQDRADIGYAKTDTAFLNSGWCG